MPRLSQADRLERYRTKIKHSIRWRQANGYTATWRRMIEAYKGQQTPEGWEGDRALVNMTFAVGNIVIASVSTQYPKFTVKPNKMGLDDQAVIAEAVINYQWQHHDWQDQFQLATTDYVHIGHGWLKSGWRYEEETETVTLTPEERDAAIEMENLNLSMQAMEDTEGAADLPTPEEVAAEFPETQEQVTVLKDEPFVERISPFDVVVDPEGTHPSSIRWIAHRRIRHLEEVREDESYDVRGRNKVQADMAVFDPDMDEPLGDEDLGGDVERVTVWEFYDLYDGHWCVFAENGDGFLRKPEKIPYPDRLQFTMFRNHDVPDHFYPVGDLEMMEPLQEELNKTRTQAIGSRKQFVRKFVARGSALDDQARQALASDQDGEVVVVNDDTVPLDQVIIHAPYLTFDPGVFNAHGQTITQDLQTVTGLSDYQFAQMPDSRRLATEAMAVQGATNARASFQLAKIERSLAQVGRRVLQNCQQFMEGEQVARISGVGGGLLFQYMPEDIQGEFDLVVEAGSTQPNNDMLRRQEAMSLFNTLAPLMGTVVNPIELTKYVLQQGFDVKNVDRFFLQQPMLAPQPPPGGGASPPGGGPEGGMEPPPEPITGAVPPGGEDMSSKILAGMA